MIFATSLLMTAVGANSQQTTTPAKSEPAKSESVKTTPATSPAPSDPSSAGKNPAPSKPAKKIDINNATLSELRALPLGEAEAKKVIAHRPYKAKGELMTKAGLPEGVYFVIKDRVELQKPRKPAPKK